MGVDKEVAGVLAYKSARVAGQRVGVQAGRGARALEVITREPGIEHAVLQRIAVGGEIAVFVAFFLAAGRAFGFVAFDFCVGRRAPLPLQLEAALQGLEGGRKEVFGTAFGVVFFGVGAGQGKAHFSRAVGVGKAAEEFAAFDVVAAFGGPVKVGILAMVGHGIGGAAATTGAGNEVALVPVAAEKGVQVVIAVGGLALRQFLAAEPGQLGGPTGNALRQGLVQVGQHLRAPVVEDAVDAKVKLGGIEFEDVLLEQVQKTLLRRGVGRWVDGAGWGGHEGILN